MLLWGLSLFRVNFSTAVITANSFYRTRPVQNVFMAHVIPFYPCELNSEDPSTVFLITIVTFSQNNNYLKIILLALTNLHLFHPGMHWNLSFFDFILLTFWPLQRKRISSWGFFYQGHLYFERFITCEINYRTYNFWHFWVVFTLGVSDFRTYSSNWSFVKIFMQRLQTAKT